MLQHERFSAINDPLFSCLCNARWVKSAKLPHLPINTIFDFVDLINISNMIYFRGCFIDLESTLKHITPGSQVLLMTESCTRSRINQFINRGFAMDCADSLEVKTIQLL